MNFAFIDKQNTLYFFPADELESASLPIQAMDGARYILTEQEGDEVIHSVAAERVGNDLHLRLLNEQQTPSAIVLQDFYLTRGSIHGLTDSGEYRLHLSADDSAAQGPVAWASESLGMRQDQVDAPFLSLIQREVTVQALQKLAESLTPSEEQAQGEAQAKPTLLMAENPVEGDSNLAGQPSISGLYDQVGSQQGLINGSNVTDDKHPKLEGTGEPGSTLEIWLNGEEIFGTVVVDEQGQWSFTPKAALSDGGHIFYVRDPATDTRSGNVAVIVDTVAPDRAEISSIADNRSGTGVVIDKNNGHTGDNTPLLTGKADPNSMVAIYIGGKYFLSVQSDNTGHWSFQPPEGFEFKDGRYDFSISAVDFAGNIGLRSSTYSITIDTLAPNVPTIGSVYDDVGNVTGALVPGAATDDTLPTLSGQAEPGVTVIIRDKGEWMGEVQADAQGKWSFTPKQPLDEGEHRFTVEALDAAGNRSGQSPVWNLVIDTTAPEQPGTDGEGPGISEVIDDVGTILGPIEKGATTDDATPTFNGTGLNAAPGFAEKVIEKVSQSSGIRFSEAHNHFEAQAAQDSLVETSGALRTIAVSLVKIANDLRWMGSGPRTGIGEIALPDLQPGSSIMPGKVNPVICEATLMACAQVIGNDVTVTTAGAAGNFELNVMLPVLAKNILESIRLLAATSRLLADRCVDGITAEAEHARELAESSPSIVTPLNRYIGYEAAAKVVKQAVKERRTIRDVVIAQGFVGDGKLTEAQLDEALDVLAMTRPPESH